MSTQEITKTSQIIVGIDASNSLSGGAITHLRELLNHYEPNENVARVIIWGKQNLLKDIRQKRWLKKVHVPVLERSLLYRQFWRFSKLKKLAEKENCDVLIIPGSIYLGSFRPIIPICQNALPYCEEEKKRFGWSWIRIKMELTRILQLRTFNRSAGILFCSDFTQSMVESIVKRKPRSTVAYVGINADFYQDVKSQKSINTYNEESPFKLLYVSTISAYKHHAILAEAICRLNREGFSIHLQLIGRSIYKPSSNQLTKILDRYDPQRQYITLTDFVESYQDLMGYYKDADGFVFSSTCENLPNILVEAMASGLPIASSNYGPMPEILKDDGAIYFDPVSLDSCYEAIKRLVLHPDLRHEIAKKAQEYSKFYSWKPVAKNTFDFIYETLDHQ